jgi:hypothetical protein
MVHHTVKNLFIMLPITANDLKTKGIAAIEAGLADHTEAFISVRGKELFAVMLMEQYHFLRECELDLALVQSRADIAAGKFTKHSAASHISDIKAALSAA